MLSLMSLFFLLNKFLLRIADTTREKALNVQTKKVSVSLLILIISSSIEKVHARHQSIRYNKLVSSHDNLFL